MINKTFTAEFYFYFYFFEKRLKVREV